MHGSGSARRKISSGRLDKLRRIGPAEASPVSTDAAETFWAVLQKLV
jgi:hypothetical protein